MKRYPRKADSAAIISHIDFLRAEPWLGEQRAHWPDFVWHYSEIENVAKILLGGRIYSREQLIARGIITTEIAQRAIIDQSDWCHPYVRLYFRPCTPTQHAIEGIRRPEEIIRNAHCPAPVFLLFDSRDLLTRANCEFTDCNFARFGYDKGDTAKFLSGLNFRDIYHDAPTGALTSDRKRTIIGARCAEVLFRDELDLDSLKEVVCRTPAERSTLLRLLGGEARQWHPIVRVARPNERIFFREYTYVKEVRLLEDSVQLEFSRRAGPPIPFEAVVTLSDGSVRRYSNHLNTQRLKLNLSAPETRVRVELRLAGALAYLGHPSRQALF